MTWQSTKPSASNGGRHHEVRFRSPKAGVSMGELAKRLIELKLIDEAYVDSCEGGFVAKVRFAPGAKPKYPSSYIAKYVSKDFGKVMSNYQYKK